MKAVLPRLPVLTAVALLALVPALPSSAAAPDTTRGKMVYMVSLSGGETGVDRSDIYWDRVDMPVVRADVFLWQPEVPLYFTVGFSHGWETEGEGGFSSNDLRWYARADYVDAALGARMPVSSHFTFHTGFGICCISKGHVRATVDGRQIAEEDLTRFGPLVHLGAVATTARGLAFVLAARIRGLSADEEHGDTIETTQNGGLELAAGLGWEFGRTP